MDTSFRQAGRLGRLTTALGPDALVLLRFEGVDHLNDLFDYRVEALATRSDLDFDALVGTHATVRVESRGGGQHFDGIVTQARWAGVAENGHRYDLTLRPWFWLAGRRRNQRIFHDKTVVEILQELLADYAGLGDPAVEFRLSQDYPVREYTVQYRESDLEFARRQMERHGISFHFRHAEGSHTLVLTDDVAAHDNIGARPYKGFDRHHQADGEHFWDWSPERNLTTGAIRLTDYNFKTPDAAMETERQGDAAHAQGRIESFDYPGDYLAQPVGKIVAGLRTSQERGGDRRNRAAGDCVSLMAGRRLMLTGDPAPGVGEGYVCLSASHQFVSEAYGTGGPGAGEYAFSGSYVLMPDTAPLAPPRRSPVPVVHGPQTAVVVGEGEIDCDEYGRILVQFHWDLAGAFSMRCRVSQNWAGAGWGGMVIPRIGMEVVVEFLEGDPDKPLVTGCVYNGRNQVPYELPQRKTLSTFKTDTHQGTGFNELRFEDQANEEEIRIIAQKDLNTLVRNSEARIVMNDSATSVLDNCMQEIGGNWINAVGGSYTLYTGPSGIDAFSSQGLGAQTNMLSRMAYALDRIALKGNGTPGDFTIISDGSHDVTVTGSISQYAGQNIDQVVGGNLSSHIGQNVVLSVKGSQQQSIGTTRTDFIGDRYVIVCGNSRIEMDKAGNIKISGLNLTVNMTDKITMTAKDIKLEASNRLRQSANQIEQN